MKTTARARIERAVEKEYQKWLDGGCRDHGWLTIAIISVMAERARLKRGVRKLKAFRCFDIQTQDEYQVVKLNDILALWER